MTDKWADYKKKFCGCKDASRSNACKGLPNCELPDGHAERKCAAPRQPEGEGLEVVAWQDAENPLYTTAERRVLHDWANNGYPIVELCRLSDHQRAIAELDRKVWEWSSAATAEAHRVDELKAERDTLRQQLAERDATVERLEAGIPRLQEQAYQARKQCDKLAGLLRDARELIDHGDFREGWCMCGSGVEGHSLGDGHTPVDAGEYYAGQVRERIDAALVEVNK